VGGGAMTSLRRRFWQLVLASWTWDEVEALAAWADEAESAREW
jgi:hypothetical protein